MQALRGHQHFAQDGARTQQAQRWHHPGLHRLQAIHATAYALLHCLAQRTCDAARHGGMGIVLVHHRDVIKHILLLLQHASHAVLHDHRQLVGKAGVIGNAVGNGGGNQMRAAVLVLQTLARERGATGRAADEKTARTRITGRPGQITDALKAEDRVVDVERQHRQAVGGIAGGGGDP